MRKIRVGSRGSDLALVQSRGVMAALRAGDTPCELELEIIQTEGDRVTDRPLTEIGGTGIFIKEIERALQDERIDLAVHSMKDLPSQTPEGLTLAATSERADPRDVLVSREAGSVETLPEKASVATGSARRKSQLLAMRPDLCIHDLRGNVPTRVRKFEQSSWDAIVLAAAGLKRLDMEKHIRGYIPTETMIPAVGQGALALETRSDDVWLRDLVQRLHHHPTAHAVTAERAFLRRLEGGCQAPIAGHATLEGDRLELRGYVGTTDGSSYLRRRVSGTAADAEMLGLSLAESFLSEGAATMVQQGR